MAYCDVCGNFDEEYREEMGYPKDSDHCIQDYQPDCYYYWDSPIEEIYYWRDAFPHVDCMCEICFDIANFSKKIIWSDHQVCHFVNCHITGCIQLPPCYINNVNNNPKDYDS